MFSSHFSQTSCFDCCGCDVESVKNGITTISRFCDASKTHPRSGWCELGTLALMAADMLQTIML